MKKILKAALRQCFILNIVLEFSRCKIFWINSLMNRNSRHGRLERRKGKEFWVLIHHPNLANMCAYCACCHFSCVWLFETLWTVACQAPLFMGYSRQEYWSGLPCPPQEDLPHSGIKPPSLTYLTLAGGFYH